MASIYDGEHNNVAVFRLSNIGQLATFLIAGFTMNRQAEQFTADAWSSEIINAATDALQNGIPNTELFAFGGSMKNAMFSNM